MKFCICFFGVISRSLRKTINSIETNIFNVLKENKIEYDVFVHNNIIEKIYNDRNNADEINIKINNDDYKLLNPTKYDEDEQIIFDKTYEWKLEQNTNGIICENTYKNAIRQLYSVKRVTELWENDTEYDLYLYIRPDLLYVNKLDISLILKNIDNENLLFTPIWDQNSPGLGLNDRIYFGKKNVMLKIAKRIDLIPKLYESKMYNAEKFMKAVVDYYNINTVFIELRGERIRSNGLNQEEINNYKLIMNINRRYIRRYEKLIRKYNRRNKNKNNIKKNILLLKKSKLLIYNYNILIEKKKKLIIKDNIIFDNNNVMSNKIQLYEDKIKKINERLLILINGLKKKVKKVK